MNSFFRGLGRFFIVLSVILFANESYSEVVIIVPENNQYAYNIAIDVQTQLKGQSTIRYEVGNPAPGDIIVALGSGIYNKIGDIRNKVIATFVPYQGVQKSQATNNRYYIYSEPSPKQIHTFIAANFSSSKIGYLYTDQDKGVPAELAKQFTQSENTLLALKNEGDVFSSIRELIRNDIDIMLLSKNSDLYTSKNIRTIIEALTRKRIPVITTTKSLVASGATISITADQSEIVAMTATLANKLNEQNGMGGEASGHTTTVNIETNQSMIDIYRFNIVPGGEK
jgi:hypothetical protein